MRFVIGIFYLLLLVTVLSTTAESNVDLETRQAKKKMTRQAKSLRRASQCNYLGSSSLSNQNEVNRHFQIPVWAQNTSLYILGALKRDPGDEQSLLQVIRDLSTLLRHWPSYTFIVYADTGAREYFRKLGDRCVYIIRESYSHHSRTHRLAYARNALWNQTRYMSALRGEDPARVFVLMMDLDAINAYGFHSDVLAKVMSETDQWDILSFYRKWYWYIKLEVD